MIKIVEIKEFSTDIFQAVEKYCQILLNEPFLLAEDYFRQILESDNSHLFLIYSGDNIAGMLTVGTYKSPTGAKAWIEDVVVDDSYRGQGLGKSIVRYAIEYVKAAGIDSLMLTSNPTRIAANKLYQNLDFVQKETNVYKITFTK